jgi:hypothetical protein
MDIKKEKETDNSKNNKQVVLEKEKEVPRNDKNKINDTNNKINVSNVNNMNEYQYSNTGVNYII